MKEQVRECAEYFRVRPGYHRILIALRQKYERFGRAAGTVQLPDASDAECEAARLLFGRPFSSPVRFQASQFETALQQTRFQGVCLKEVLEAYFGVEIKTSREVQETQERCLASILDQAAKNARGETSAQWVHALKERQARAWTGWSCRQRNQSAWRCSVRRPPQIPTPWTVERGAGNYSCTCCPSVPVCQTPERMRNSETISIIRTAFFATAFPAWSRRLGSFLAQRLGSILPNVCFSKDMRSAHYHWQVCPMCGGRSVPQTGFIL